MGNPINIGSKIKSIRTLKEITREELTERSGLSIEEVKQKHMSYHSLSKSKADRHMESFIIDIEKDNNTSYNVSSHEGEEFIYVLEGEIEIVHGKNKYCLKKADSIYYDSIVPHHVHGSNGQPARILAVIYTPA